MKPKPFFMRSKEEIEGILPKDSAEREKALKSLEHSVSFYDLDGNHRPHLYEKENLLEVISQRDMYVIDSNSDWRKECNAHRDKAFIITPALSRENPNTIDLILDSKRSKFGSLFSVGLYAEYGLVMIERVDEHYGHIFDLHTLSAASKDNDENKAKRRGENLTIVKNEKIAIQNHIWVELLFTTSLDHIPISMNFMHSRKASDLPSPEELKGAIERLKANIIRRLPLCKYSIKKSKVVAEFCYATLLLEETKHPETREKFDRPNYEHVFGDMHILQSAIHLGAKILTKDNGLIQMASYANVKCCHVP